MLIRDLSTIATSYASDDYIALDGATYSTRRILVSDLLAGLSGGGGGSGTVTTVSITTANGISGTVATASTTPAITLSLGAINPTSIGGVTPGAASFTTLSSTGVTTFGGSDLSLSTLLKGATKGVRIGFSASGSAIEGVDNTGTGSYQALYLGGSQVNFTSSGTTVGSVTSTGLNSCAVGATTASTGSFTTWRAKASTALYYIQTGVDSSSTSRPALSFNDSLTGAGMVGFRASGSLDAPGLLFYSVPTGGTHRWQVNATTVAELDPTGLNGCPIGAADPRSGVFTTLQASTLGVGTPASTMLLAVTNNTSGLPANPSASQYLVHVGNTTGTSPAVLVDGTNAAAMVVVRRAAGTLASPSATTTGSLIGLYGFMGYGATTFSGRQAVLQATATETWTDSAQGVKLEMRVTAIGSTTLTTVATFDSTGLNSCVIGAGTAAAGSFTTLSASSTVSGAGFTAYFASPPTIGGTAPGAATFTTLAATTFSTTGLVTSAGATLTTANPCSGTTPNISIDTTKGLNTKSIVADSQFIFSATPAANTWTVLRVANTDAANHVVTVPSCFDVNTQTTRTTFTVLAGGAETITFCYDGTVYHAYGMPSASYGAEITVASATTTDLGALAGINVSITGTTTITGFGTVAAGTYRQGRFTGALTLTHNATSLIIPGGVNRTTVAGDRFGAYSLGAGNWVILWYTQLNGTTIYASGKTLTVNQTTVLDRQSSTGLPVEFCIAVGDESTAITTGTGKVTFRAPYAFTLTEVRASVNTAPTGSTILIDVNETGTTVLSTKLMIDATEKTSTTAATPYVISDSAIADDAELSIDFDQVGSTVAGAGVKVWLKGYR